MLANRERANASAAEIVEWLAEEHPDLGPTDTADERTPWQLRVPSVYAESMQLARQLDLL
jgi:hypothetical protein